MKSDQVINLYYFSLNQQYSVNVSCHRLRDTKVIQYQGSFAESECFQTSAKAMQGSLHCRMHTLGQIKGLSPVNIH